MTTLVRSGHVGARMMRVRDANEEVVVDSPRKDMIRRVLRLRAMNEDTVKSLTLKTRVKETDQLLLNGGGPEHLPLYPTGLPALAPAEMRDDIAPENSEIFILTDTQQIVEEIDQDATDDTDGIVYLATWIDEVRSGDTG